MSRNRGLDLLRSAAVLSVVLFHYPKASDQLWLRALAHYGWTGVDLFFVLSGFLIASQYFSRKVSGKPISIKCFYTRRFLRTLPNYFAVLAVYSLLGKVSGSESWRYLVFIQNFSALSQFSHSWSLCVEEQFYLFFPVLALLLPRFPLKWQIATATVMVMAAGALIRYLIWTSERPDLIYAVDLNRSFEVYLSRIFYPTYARLDGLAIGIGLASVRVQLPRLWQSWMQRPGRWLASGFTLLAFAALALHWRMSFTGVVFGFPLLAAGFGALLVHSISESSLFGRVNLPGVSTLALLSYSMYLTHGLALELAEQAMKAWRQPNTGLAMAATSLVLIPACSAALYLSVERPFMRLRDRIAAA